ncbi:MAG: PH domain-containing protein [Mucilaginibacter sp.]
METEYTTSTGYKFFYGALGLGAIIFGVALFKVTNTSTPAFAYLIPVALLILGASILGNLFKRKAIISDNSIKYINIFRTTELPFDHVKGVRIGEKVLYIEADDANYRKITIKDYVSLDDSEGLTAWLTTNFKDLDKEDFETEKDTILHDPTLGATEAERERKLKNFKRFAVVYSVGGIAVFLGSMFLDQKWHYIVYLALIYPFIGVGLMGLSHGLVRLVAGKKSAYASVLTGLMMPSFLLFFQYVLDTNILSYNNLWSPAVIVGSVMLVLIYFTGIRKAGGASNPANPFAAQIIVAVLISAAYGFGSTMEVNTIFDKSDPQTYTTTVIDQHIHTGKSTTYYLTLNAWGPHLATGDVSVSKSFYYRAQVGTTINVYLKKGTLNIPWYYIRL